MRESANETILRDVRVEVVADHQHVEVLLDRVDRVGPGRVGRRWQDVIEGGDPDDVRRVASPGALGVVGVDRPPGDRRQGVLQEAGLVDRVGVERDLDIQLVGHPQGGVDRGRGRSPVLVQLQGAGAGFDLKP